MTYTDLCKFDILFWYGDKVHKLQFKRHAASHLKTSTFQDGFEINPGVADILPYENNFLALISNKPPDEVLSACRVSHEKRSAFS